MGLEPTEPGASGSSGRTQSNEKNSEPEFRSVLRSAPMPSDSQCNKILPTQVGAVGDFMATKSPLTGGAATGSIPQWQLDEFLGINDFSQNFCYPDNGSSKVWH